MYLLLFIAVLTDMSIFSNEIGLNRDSFHLSYCCVKCYIKANYLSNSIVEFSKVMEFFLKQRKCDKPSPGNIYLIRGRKKYNN